MSDLFMKGSMDTIAYISSRGYLVLKQENIYANKPQEILLSLEQTEDLVAYITNNLQEQKEIWHTSTNGGDDGQNQID